MRKQNEGWQRSKVLGKELLGYLESSDECRKLICGFYQLVHFTTTNDFSFRRKGMMAVAKLADL